jgi:tRNA threonylcarbamoyladenosine biosynthesis protein TsaB
VDDIDSVAISGGPGSFTGLRVGAGFAKGFIVDTSRKLYAVSSLETTAANLLSLPVPVCVMFDARKGEVYSGTYRWMAGVLEVLSEPVSARPEIVVENLESDTAFVGSGSRLYRDVIVDRLGEKAIFAPSPFNNPRAGLMGHLVFTDPDRYIIEEPGTFEPTYIRLPEAVVKWKKIERK